MDNIIIEENDLELAQTLCSAISDTDCRNRAVANVIGAKIAAKFFNPDVYNVDIDTALHNVAIVNEKYELSDIYVNNAYVDVRVYFTEEELCVPKSHFDTEVLPEAYMFIKLSQDLSSGTVTGFIFPNNINKENEKNNYYYVSETNLVTLYDVDSHFNNALDTVELSTQLIYEYIEGSLDTESENNLFKNLTKSKNARTIFIKTVKAQSVLNIISSVEIPEEPKNTVDSNEDLDNLYTSENNDTPASDNNDDSLLEELEFSTEVTPSGSEVIDSLDNSEQAQNENSEQIDTLFTGEQSGVPVASNKNSKGFFVVLLLFIIACAGGYWWYTNIYSQNNNSLPDLQETAPAMTEETIEPLPVEQPSAAAMPNETVNNVPETASASKEAGNSVEIPAIEQNLDASVLVSNLKVDWEVPAGYVSNTAARRYLVKLGKIIQLNLKSELLLLSKPPIANKITVELTFNPTTNRFEIVGMQNSSGEKTVDDTIMETVRTAIKMNISSNFESFGKLQGNPILIIHL